MSDSRAQASQGASPQQAALTINAQYIKDLSFEIPGAPAIFGELSQTAPPELNVQVGVDSQQLGEQIYEATLRLTLEAKIRDKTAFLCDLTYGGVFTLMVPAEHLQLVLWVECPRLLFPFARGIVADATRDGGFPPVLLQPLDFVELYRQRLAHGAEDGKAPAPTGQA